MLEHLLLAIAHSYLVASAASAASMLANIYIRENPEAPLLL